MIQRKNTVRERIDLDGPAGNAHVLIGLTIRTLEDDGKSQEYIQKVIDEMTAGDYLNLVSVMDREIGNSFIFETAQHEILAKVSINGDFVVDKIIED